MKVSPDVAALNPGLALARAVPAGAGPYRSKLEARAAWQWIPNQMPRQWWYEPVTFILPGGRYTPDFMMVGHDDLVRFVEVKGYSRSIRASRKAFLEAARTHTWAMFCWLTWEHGEWVGEWIRV